MTSNVPSASGGVRRETRSDGRLSGGLAQSVAAALTSLVPVHTSPAEPIRRMGVLGYFDDASVANCVVSTIISYRGFTRRRTI